VVDVLAILCPGQGSQTAGFLTSWTSEPDFVDRLAALNDAAGFDLVGAGTDPSADVVDTAVAQPLLVAVAATTAELLGELSGCVVAGHSVGELAAAAVAGSLSSYDAVRLAAGRGMFMAAASAAADGGMTALLGGDESDVLAAVERAGCVAANVNGGGQLVAAGTAAALDRLDAELPRGARARRLSVAGPFHSPAMAPARDGWEPAVTATTFRGVTHPMLSNLDGAVVTSGDDIAYRLVQQVSAPVRWDRCVAGLRELGVSAAIELAPGGVLAGMVRRQLPDVETVALRTPDDLVAARALVHAHRPHGEQVQTDWQLITAPARGTFHPAEGRRGLGVVRTRSGDEVIDLDGDVVEWLALDGDPVNAGQPLARVTRGRA
jgi:[acyl-carrier-protein] S-malonyltransferase